jgi:WD40 repeat protein
MAQKLVWLLMACLVLVPLRSSLAQGPEETEIARLIKQLGNDDFGKRDAAAKGLVEIGKPALAAVQKAKSGDDPEVRFRAQQIASEIEAAIDNKLYGKELLFAGHTSHCVSNDGRRLLTSSSDQKLRLWDTDTGKELRVFAGHTNSIQSAALSPDGKRVLSGSLDGTVRLWDVDTGKELRQMTGHTDVVWSVAFGPEGRALSGGGDADGTMRVWDLNTCKQAAAFSVDGYPIGVAYSAKAKLAATWSWTRIRLWDLETGKEVRKLFGGHSNYVMSVCFSPRGERLLSASLDGTVRIWDVKSGKGLNQIQAHEEGHVGGGGAYCAAFSPDGKRIASGGEGGIRVWDAESGKEVHKYEGDTGGVSVTFFPDGKRIVSTSADGTARIWRAPR